MRPRPKSTSRDQLRTITTLLQGFPATWWVCGGWSIDACIGRQTREHSDIEIGIARDDQGHIHDYLPDWEIYKIVDKEIVQWEGERLELPIHQIVMQHPELPEFEFFLNEIADDIWHFRRQPDIRLPSNEATISSPWGFAVAAPEIQLLYKSTYHRPQDEHDFAQVLPYLDEGRRSRLREMLQGYRPDDFWLSQLQ